MSLLVLAFPDLDPADLDWIQNYRKENDLLQYALVAPHFTLVFAVDDQDEAAFIEEIERQSQNIPVIELKLQKALFHKDALSSYSYEFLVPEPGYEAIVRLHDQLYAGALQPHLRADIGYIPHITIGNNPDELKCRRAVERLNEAGVSVAGCITQLTIVWFADGVVTRIKEIPLVEGSNEGQTIVRR